jgi:molecular chaperone DnaK
MRTIGIDLGTTNTVAAIDGIAMQHASGLDSSPILPSVVAFPPSGAVLTGATAKKRRAIDPKNTIYSAKRLMGQRWLSYAGTQFRKHYPFELVETKAGACAFETRAGRQTPVDIGAKLVEKIFAARTTLRSSLTAVVAVPAAFESAGRDATRKAVEQAGVERVTIVDEPVATAVAYATARNERLRYALVYDLGGGTFDLAIIDCSQPQARVIRHAGDPYLGGDDIDRAISDWVAVQVLARHGLDLRSDAEVFDRLVVQCELAKVRLGSNESALIELGQIDPAAPAGAQSVVLERAKLAELAQPLVGRTFLLCDQVLREAGLRSSDIDAVYLAGGTTLMPIVREGVASYFGKLPRCELDPMQVVAVGASLMMAG